MRNAFLLVALAAFTGSAYAAGDELESAYGGTGIPARTFLRVDFGGAPPPAIYLAGLPAGPSVSTSARSGGFFSVLTGGEMAVLGLSVLAFAAVISGGKKGGGDAPPSGTGAGS